MLFRSRRTGARPGPNGLARRSALTFLRAGRQTIVFGRSRTGVEILLTGIREALREHRGPVTSVRGYRGGYLPGERREIERGLRDGEILGVVSTNALELGIDIGGLDAAVLAGYPGTIAATRQQCRRFVIRRDGGNAGTAAAPAAIGQRIGEFFATHSSLREENDKLRRENLAQALAAQQYKALATENAHLRGLLGARERVEAAAMPAEEIGRAHV